MCPGAGLPSPPPLWPQARPAVLSGPTLRPLVCLPVKRWPSAICSVQPRAWSLRVQLVVCSVFAAILIIVVTAAVLLTRKKPGGPLAVTVSLASAGSGGSGPNGRWALQLGLNQAPSCQQTGASLAEELPALGTSLIRTHDQRALDLFTLFPNPTADPEDLANYNFSNGDALFADIRATKHRVYLRLGVSWPLGAPPVLPPVPAWSLCPPAELMARVSLHTVQHYSALFPNQIAYVEVWNEPDGTIVEALRSFTRSTTLLQPRSRLISLGYGWVGQRRIPARLLSAWTSWTSSLPRARRWISSRGTRTAQRQVGTRRVWLRQWRLCAAH